MEVKNFLCKQRLRFLAQVPLNFIVRWKWGRTQQGKPEGIRQITQNDLVLFTTLTLPTKYDKTKLLIFFTNHFPTTKSGT